METGVVVIGRNEGERLIRCLSSIAPVCERIVYVDSGSTDGSIAAAHRFGAVVVGLDTRVPFTAARARNAGYRELLARCGNVAFVNFIDGDCELDREWLPAAVGFLKARDDVAVVCGRRRERHPEASVYNRLCDLEWNTPIGAAAACGGDSLMRAVAFESVGGFNDALVAGEEPELCGRLRRAGWNIWRLDQEMTLHDAAMTRFGQWWTRSVRGGFGYAQVWAVTRDFEEPLYRREAVRAALWGGLLPFAAALAALLHPAALATAAALYGIQILRIAVRRRRGGREAWLYGTFAILAKFPECQGLLRFLRRAAGAGGHSSLQYK